MSFIKKIALSAGIIAGGLLSAQNSEGLSMKNMLKVGANIGHSLPASNFGLSAGIDVAYQYLVTPHFGLGLATGYTHFFGRDNKATGNITLNNNDAGLIPAALLLRYYPDSKGIYFGADLGYGFITSGDNYVAAHHNTLHPDGGFYIKPELGYHNRNWNFFLQYQKVFTGNEGKILNQDYQLGGLSVGVSYNIALGK